MPCVRIGTACVVDCVWPLLTVCIISIVYNPYNSSYHVIGTDKSDPQCVFGGFSIRQIISHVVALLILLCIVCNWCRCIENLGIERKHNFMQNVDCAQSTHQNHTLPTKTTTMNPLQWSTENINVESAPLTTTGGHTWPAAYHLFTYLEYAYDVNKHNMRKHNLRVLELGSGCGWLSIALAANLPTATVCATEQDEGGALAWLQHNVQRSGVGNVQTAPCDWTTVLDVAPNAQQNTVLEQPWDLIIGSDLVYNQAGTQWLPLVLGVLLRRCPVALYCHTKHRYDLLDMEFFEALKAHNIVCTEVYDPSSPPPGSPPLVFPGDLFGEQRRAVLQLTAASSAMMGHC